ncbi:hypothetical protein IFVP182_C1270004 [Vibrio parahaemolyticus]
MCSPDSIAAASTLAVTGETTSATIKPIKGDSNNDNMKNPIPERPLLAAKAPTPIDNPNHIIIPNIHFSFFCQ